MELITGRDEIILALSTLSKGQEAMLQVVDEHLISQSLHVSVNRFRKVSQTENGKWYWQNRNARTSYMIGLENEWFRSCFQHEYSDLKDNIERMFDHDDEEEEHLMVTACIIYEPKDYYKALVAIQQDCYVETRLERYGCEMYRSIIGDKRETTEEHAEYTPAITLDELEKQHAG